MHLQLIQEGLLPQMQVDPRHRALIRSLLQVQAIRQAITPLLRTVAVEAHIVVAAAMEVAEAVAEAVAVLVEAAGEVVKKLMDADLYNNWYPF